MSDIIVRLHRHALPDPHDEREVMHAPLLREAAEEIRMLRVDAERYRFIRRKFAIVGDEFVAINLPRPVYRAPDAACELDAVIDQARQKLACDQAVAGGTR